jgi:hypothetical protein
VHLQNVHQHRGADLHSGVQWGKEDPASKEGQMNLEQKVNELEERVKGLEEASFGSPETKTLIQAAEGKLKALEEHKPFPCISKTYPKSKSALSLAGVPKLYIIHYTRLKQRKAGMIQRLNSLLPKGWESTNLVTFVEGKTVFTSYFTISFDFRIR